MLHKYIKKTYFFYFESMNIRNTINFQLNQHMIFERFLFLIQLNDIHTCSKWKEKFFFVIAYFVSLNIIENPYQPEK